MNREGLLTSTIYRAKEKRKILISTSGTFPLCKDRRCTTSFLMLAGDRGMVPHDSILDDTRAILSTNLSVSLSWEPAGVMAHLVLRFLARSGVDQ